MLRLWLRRRGFLVARHRPPGAYRQRGPAGAPGRRSAGRLAGLRGPPLPPGPVRAASAAPGTGRSGPAAGRGRCWICRAGLGTLERFPDDGEAGWPGAQPEPLLVRFGVPELTCRPAAAPTIGRSRSSSRRPVSRPGCGPMFPCCSPGTNCWRSWECAVASQSARRRHPRSRRRTALPPCAFCRPRGCAGAATPGSPWGSFDEWRHPRQAHRAGDRFRRRYLCGQVVARLNDCVPELPIIDLVHDLPPFRPDLAAYLLPALVRDMPRGTLYLCVVDPGVGGDRRGLVLEADGDLFVGPGQRALESGRAAVDRRARALDRLAAARAIPQFPGSGLVRARGRGPVPRRTPGVARDRHRRA